MSRKRFRYNARCGLSTRPARFRRTGIRVDRRFATSASGPGRMSRPSITTSATSSGCMSRPSCKPIVGGWSRPQLPDGPRTRRRAKQKLADFIRTFFPPRSAGPDDTWHTRLVMREIMQARRRLRRSGAAVEHSAAVRNSAASCASCCRTNTSDERTASHRVQHRRPVSVLSLRRIRSSAIWWPGASTPTTTSTNWRTTSPNFRWRRLRPRRQRRSPQEQRDELDRAQNADRQPRQVPGHHPGHCVRLAVDRAAGVDLLRADAADLRARFATSKAPTSG